MAVKEMYDYLTATAASSTELFDVKPQKILTELGRKNQVAHIGDDGSEQRVSFSNTSVFNVVLKWNVISAADAGTIMDYFHSTSLGNGISRSFRWSHPTDGHTYTVRFASDLSQFRQEVALYGFKDVTFKVLGRAT